MPSSFLNLADRPVQRVSFFTPSVSTRPPRKINNRCGSQEIKKSLARLDIAYSSNEEEGKKRKPSKAFTGFAPLQCTDNNSFWWMRDEAILYYISIRRHLVLSFRSFKARDIDLFFPFIQIWARCSKRGISHGERESSSNRSSHHIKQCRRYLV